MNKYVAMMRERSDIALENSGDEERNGQLKWAAKYRQQAADWRAAAEAFEALVEALKLADVHIGWTDCSLENVHKQCRAALALAEPKEE